VCHQEVDLPFSLNSANEFAERTNRHRSAEHMRSNILLQLNTTLQTGSNSTSISLRIRDEL